VKLKMQAQVRAEISEGACEKAALARVQAEDELAACKKEMQAGIWKATGRRVFIVEFIGFSRD